MRKKAIMITGAAGEIGLALVESLANAESHPIITLDLQSLPDHIARKVTHVQGDISDKGLLSRLISEYEIETIYHLAALLSTRSEFTPETAHRVNVEARWSCCRWQPSSRSGVVSRCASSSPARLPRTVCLI